MKKKIYLSLILTIIIGMGNLKSNADGWVQKADFGGTARNGATGFSIGTKGYIGTGVDGSNSQPILRNDFWEYDQGSNTWSQKANFGGSARDYATGFSIGTKGYIGTGYDGSSSFTNDFWEYDQSSNTWTQKASLGSNGRYHATGFSIGTKGYIGTGLFYSGSLIFTKDFWEYDQGSNTWTQKANFGGTARNVATGFSIGIKGYIGMGNDDSIGLRNDFWEYDQSINIWSQKANFGGTARDYATGFSIGTKGYIGTGLDGNNRNDFWEYDQDSNTWMQKATFGGTARRSATGFSIGTKGYIGTGYDGIRRNDFWEYTPDGFVAAVPTLSQWGLIALSVLVLGAGIFFIKRNT
jgi:N-acetylneuraminic acid mutarotase